MSQWNQIHQLSQESQQQIHSLYGEQFPIEVRCAFAQWIEDKPWRQLNADYANHEEYASNLVNAFAHELKNRVLKEEDMILKHKLLQWSIYYSHNYANNPFLLVKIVKQCLITEAKIIAQSLNHLNIPNVDQKHNIVDPHRMIAETIDNQRKHAIKMEDDIKTMQSEQETFIIQYQQSEKRQIAIQQLNAQNNGQSAELMAKWKKEKESFDAALKQKASAILQTRLEKIGKMEETVSALKAIMEKVLNDELIKWKRAQQLSANGIIFDNNLDQIQEWCESLAEITWQSRQHIKRVEILCQQLPFGNHSLSAIEKLVALDKHVIAMLSYLVKRTFIIEKQPPQVMKINTKFTSTTRLLVGGKLNLHMTPPLVTVTIINESQASHLINNDTNAFTSCKKSGEILNNSVTMEYQPSVRQLSVNFRNMILKNFKRPEKRANESVMDEKFALLFQTHFKLANGELVFNVWTISLPIAVIVHGIQEAHALATVTWDNAFAETIRKPFVVPNKVLWPRVGYMLSEKFKSSVGNGLSSNNLQFLASKALRNCTENDYTNAYLSWSQFSKEPLNDRTFTFWEWFYAAIKVTREHLRQLWNDNAVMGFVSRKQTEEILATKSLGTFLIRFSDSELGGVTVAWISDSADGQTCYMLQPFTAKDFAIRSLADRVNDLKQLTFLYPDIPKDQAFGKYYTPFSDKQIKANKTGYVKPQLINVIPGFFGNGYSFDSNPNTPHSTHAFPQSPCNDYSQSSDGYSAQQNAGDIQMNFVDESATNGDKYANLIDMLCDSDAVDFTSINNLS